MNERTKLNIQALQQRNCDVAFSELFKEFRRNIRYVVNDFAKGRDRIRDEIESALNLELWTALKDYDMSRGVAVESFVDFRLKRRAGEIVNPQKSKHGSYVKRVDFIAKKSDGDEENAATFDIVDSFDLEEYAVSTKKADQRQLIDYLVEGADATTTAIVEAFLQHPKPTATAIANELGFHHSKVTRALNRLASKFSTKQYGDYHDYLIAL